MKKVLVNCPSCRGTGIYRGFVEGKGCGVVCSTCNGEGSTELKYTPFTGRVQRDDVERVFQRGAYGLAVNLPDNPERWGTSVSYAEFLAGKRPVAGKNE